MTEEKKEQKKTETIEVNAEDVKVEAEKVKSESEPKKEEQADKELEEIKDQSDDFDKKEEPYKEQLMRVHADFANYKRRIAQERSVWIASAQSDVIKVFLPFLDDVNRAIDASSEVEDKSIFQGLQLIQKNIQKVFADLGVNEIDCSKEFDPHFHEALMQIDSPDHNPGQIVKVFEPGFIIKDLVIRHAKVSVAK